MGTEDVFEDDGFGGFDFSFAVIGCLETVFHDFAYEEFLVVAACSAEEIASVTQASMNP